VGSLSRFQPPAAELCAQLSGPSAQCRDVVHNECCDSSWPYILPLRLTPMSFLVIIEDGLNFALLHNLQHRRR
jgi:hypothetical protein